MAGIDDGLGLTIFEKDGNISVTLQLYEA